MRIKNNTKRIIKLFINLKNYGYDNCQETLNPGEISGWYDGLEENDIIEINEIVEDKLDKYKKEMNKE